MTVARKQPQHLQSKSESYRIGKKPVGKNKTRKLPRQSVDSDDLEAFMQKIDKEFNKNNQMVTLPELRKYPLLTGNEKLSNDPRVKINHLSFTHQVELESKLGSAAKGLLLLSTMTTDWDIQEIEFKKLIQLVKENIPKSIGIRVIQGRTLFDTIHAWISRNSRAKSWRLIQAATWETIKDFKELEGPGRKLIRKIKQLLKPRRKENTIKNGLDWEKCLCEKPPKWDKSDMY